LCVWSFLMVRTGVLVCSCVLTHCIHDP
jgi:hypothetical protein